MKLLKRITATGLAVALAFTGMTALGGMSADAQAPKLRVGYDSLPLHVVPVIFTELKDVLKHYGTGYEVELARFRGSALQVQAMAAGEIDIGALAAPSFASGVVGAKLDLVVIADLAQDGPWFSNTFGVLTDSPVKAPADMKGKISATNAVNGASDMAVRTVLLRDGELKPDVDYRIVEAGLGAMQAMLEEGKVDLATFNSATWSAAEKSGKVRALFRMSDAMGESQFLFYAVKRDFLEANRAALVLFWQDYLRGLQYVMDPANRDRVIAAFAKFGETSVDTFKDFAFMEGKDYFHAPDGQVNPDMLQKNIDDLKELGVIKDTVNVSEHFDGSVLKDAAAGL